MDHLREQLLVLGIKRILIADDTPANLDAAREMAASLPEIQFEFYSSAEEITKAIRANPRDIGLVITDKKMETENAGVDVFELSMGWGIPTIILTGFDHHGPLTRAVSILVPTTIWKGEKNNPKIWTDTLKLFVDSTDPKNPESMHVVHNALKMATRELAEASNYDEALGRSMGNGMRRLIAGRLGL
jgi:hypothetical protein